jgi:ATP/maltotriose-dependent transcriptional regulator MalT
MSFLLHDSLNEIESAEITSSSRINGCKKSNSARLPITIIDEKFRRPTVGSIVRRERLRDLLDRSIQQYGATLVSGRAGTGKTTLAAEFASNQRKASWYTVEPAESDWREFSAAFLTCIFGKKRRLPDTVSSEPSGAVISDLLSYSFGRLARQRLKPRLVVLDNVHHLFDAEWFSEFFRQLIISLDADVRLLMLCRSKPTAPLWRLRSKQMLNVIDETMLELSEREALAFAEFHGIPKDRALPALKRSYGRVGNFLSELQR